MKIALCLAAVAALAVVAAARYVEKNLDLSDWH